MGLGGGDRVPNIGGGGGGGQGTKFSLAVN